MAHPKNENRQIAVLVQKARMGDPEAMTRLLEIAQGSVIFQCLKIMKHPEDAEDMAQEVVLTVYQSLDKLQDPEKFLAWANRIAAYMCLNQKQRHPKDLQFLEDERGHSFLDAIEDEDREHVPDAALDNAETRKLVTDLIDALPEAQRTAVYLYYYSEMSIREIAALTGVPENTVKSRLNYGRKVIKEGVLGYEKDGIKLYSLSPLPFLLFLLRGAAESQADPAAAAAAAKAVLTGTAAAAAGTGAAAGASGTVASAAAAETAAASTAGTAAAEATAAGAATAGASAGAAAGTAAGTTAAAGAASSGGLLGAVSAKVVAAVLAGVVAVGGIAAGVASSAKKDPAEPAEPPAAVEPAETGDEAEAAPAEDRWTDPVATVSCTYEQAGSMTYPVFESDAAGYQAINQFFRDLRRSEPYYPEVPLDEISAQRMTFPFTEEYELVYQDGFFVSVHLRRCSAQYMPGQRGFTFDTRTGELLTLEDLTGAPAEEIAAMLRSAVENSAYAAYLTEDNAPSADPADWDYVIRSGEVCYLWPAEPGLSAVIPLPVELPDSGMTPVDHGEVLETPAVTYRFRSLDSGAADVEFYTAIPVFDSLDPVYQAVNGYLQRAEADFSPDRTLLELAGDPMLQTPFYDRLSAEILFQDDRYLCLEIVDSGFSGYRGYSSVGYATFDLATGQEVSPRDLLDLTDEEITAIVLDWIADSNLTDALSNRPFELGDQYAYRDGQVCYVWVTYLATPSGMYHYIPLAAPSDGAG